MAGKKHIWTIGHSTHPIDEFISMLESFKIELLTDIRTSAGSRFCPQFNGEALEKSLAEAAIEYIHMPHLGGRRRAKVHSKNTAWRNASFRGYADYMETDEFKKGIAELQEFALKKPAAYMCSEAYWLKCHRSLVSDYLKTKGWAVYHIMGIGKSIEHQYTQSAHLVNGKLSYAAV